MYSDSNPIKIEGKDYLVERFMDGTPAIYDADDNGHVSAEGDNAKIPATAMFQGLKRKGLKLVLIREKSTEIPVEAQEEIDIADKLTKLTNYVKDNTDAPLKDYYTILELWKTFASGKFSEAEMSLANRLWKEYKPRKVGEKFNVLITEEIRLIDFSKDEKDYKFVGPCSAKLVRRDHPTHKNKYILTLENTWVGMAEMAMRDREDEIIFEE